MRETLSEWWDDYPVQIVCAGMTLLIAALVAVALYFDGQERAEWRAFAAQHNCQVVGKQKSSSAIGSDGKVVFISGKTGYKCNDGITYWRDDE